MPDRHDSTLELIVDRYWDTVLSGTADPPGDDVDPELVATVQRVHALDVSQPHAPLFASTLWEDLMNTHAAGVSALPLLSWPPTPSQQPSDVLGRWPSRSPDSPLSRIAAAIVLVALIAGSIVAALLPHQPRGSDRLPLSAVSQSPAAESSAVGTLELLWESTGGPEPVKRPHGIGIAPDGNIWVSDAYRDRFQILAPDGTFIETWGTSGDGEGEFEFFSQRSAHGSPYGDVAFDAAGSFYVLDTGNHRVQKFGPDRAFLLTWGTEGTEDGQFLAPGGIAVGPDGVVYVSDEARHDVQKFGSDGRWLGAFGELDEAERPLHVPSGVAVDAAGNVWVAYFRNNRIQRFSASGEPLSGWGKLGTGEGELNGPRDVAVDALGRVYVADQVNERLQVFAEDGRFLAVIGDSGDVRIPWPASVETNADGVIFAASEDQVQAFRLLLPAGDLLAP
jgi:DNA-binding beta-propeller fold protein YncE